ncbi:IclR family transcriptional regulator [Conexibacter stalactiti]|uniref:IclR family transcriptional regulator n=1 Tax=Conexibacter stalactiti TaxID=1940611 RepID=A0ABU4HZC5_9ACTN|nr:IclR family transcriptional regulator [Conexibacter stalactiti]MDW5598509.1 IclR family transcriptional regulator [Conexibacter stalactiti]MEC5039151.1 IclR family transcriptional regulator [Conexibacter stalactiti]
MRDASSTDDRTTSERAPGGAAARGGASGEAKALVKGIALLDVLLAQPDGRSLAELARATGLPKPTAHRLLGSLLAAGLVRATDDGGYALGPRCLALGSGFLDGIDLRREALPALRALSEQTGETCHLGVLAWAGGGARPEVVYIEKVDSRHSIRMQSRVGATQPALTTGLGRALLSLADEATVAAALAAGVEPRTPNTTTDPDALRALLAAARERGVALDDVENEAGIRCVAAPIVDHTGAAVAALSVSGPEMRVKPAQTERFVPLVRAAAAEVSRRLGAR